MSDESASLDSSLNLIMKNPRIILPFIFGIIIGYILTYIFDVIISIANFLIIKQLSPVALMLDSYVYFFITTELMFFFIIFAIYWQSYASSDQIENNEFSVSTTLSDTVSAIFTIILVSIFISIIYVLFSIIPFIGSDLVDPLFFASALISVIISIYNKKGYVSNLIELPNSLYMFYKKEPVSGFILLIIILLFLVPNMLIDVLALLTIAILGSVLIKNLIDSKPS
jgi:hypothetical protein